MADDEWSERDLMRALEAAQRVAVDVFTANADTAKDWQGSKNGLRVGDTRVHIKNHEEYKGLERHAWQYVAVEMYEDAANHFYSAAAWRDEDTEVIGSIDPGHTKAALTCLRMARYADANAETMRDNSGLEWPRPTDFGLTSDWVKARVLAAQEQIDAVI